MSLKNCFTCVNVSAHIGQTSKHFVSVSFMAIILVIFNQISCFVYQFVMRSRKWTEKQKQSVIMLDTSVNKTRKLIFWSVSSRNFFVYDSIFIIYQILYIQFEETPQSDVSKHDIWLNIFKTHCRKMLKPFGQNVAIMSSHAPLLSKVENGSTHDVKLTSLLSINLLVLDPGHKMLHQHCSYV